MYSIKKKFITILVLLHLSTFISHAETITYENILDKKYWQYMIGYKYDYDSLECNVRWNQRSASFVLDGKNCNQLQANQIREDAIKSINFLIKTMGEHSDFRDYYSALDSRTLNNKKKNKEPSYPPSNKLHPSRNPDYDYIQMRWTGIGIWIQGCADYAAGFTNPNKSLTETYQGNKIDKKFPTLKPNLVKDIYDNGWKNSANINFYCDRYASLVVDKLLMSVNDLRK